MGNNSQHKIAVPQIRYSVGVFVWLLCLTWIGLYLFFEGFLLTRSVIQNKSEYNESSASNETGIFQRKDSALYSRAVVVVIDALRYDFLVSSNNQSSRPFDNKLQVPGRLLTNQEEAEYAQLFKFIADAPTTTMQRLKGLTTGSLPTFIDAGNNFDSSIVEEDNWLSQLISNGKKAVVMGDDTWGSLFDGLFLRSYLFDSFNVRDLHSVDNGVVANLFPEMKEKDWTVLIAHFLGVDHCGHTFGPYHPEMAEKLNEMNTVLEDLILELDDDTILFVLGDHGMTENGDHGGDSDNEVGAGFFAYTKQAPSATTTRESSSATAVMTPKEHWEQYLRLADEAEETFERREIQQIDFVPTISLLLGLPIPFGNLGRIVPEMFFVLSDEESKKVKKTCRDRDSDCERAYSAAFRFRTLNYAMQLNAVQVENYLTTYSKMSSDFPVEELVHLTASLESIMSRHTTLELTIEAIDDGATDINQCVRNLKENYADYCAYLKRVRHMTEQTWAKFDVVSIVCGLVVLGLACSSMLLQLTQTCSPSQANRAASCIIKGAVVGLFLGITFVVSGADSVLAASGISAPDYRTVILLTISICGAAGHYISANRICSASWSEMCPRGTTMVVSACVVLHMCCFFSNSFTVWEDHVLLFLLATSLVAITLNGQHIKTTLYGRLLILILSRWAILYRVCREEQFGYGCIQPELPSLTSLFVILGLYTSFAAIGTGLWTSSGKILRHTILAQIISLASYWYLHLGMGVNMSTLPYWQQVGPPWVSYAGNLIVLIITIKELVITTEVANKGKQDSELGSISRNKKLDTMQRCLFSFSLLLSIVTEPRFVPGLFLLCTCLGQSILSARAVTYRRVTKDDPCPEKKGVDMSESTQTALLVELAYLGQVASYFFFATGHQASFPTIQWTAAFVGFTSMSYYPAVVLLVLNTYSAHLIVLASFPIILMTAASSSALTDKRPKLCTSENSKSEHDAIGLAHQIDLITRAHIWGLLFRSVILLSTAGAAAMHRRHLMVWKIFAPRFIFESAGNLVVHACLLGSLILCLIVVKGSRCRETNLVKRGVQ